MATLLGIDLGHHSVKLALMEGRLGRVELSEFRQRRVVPSDGQKASVKDRLEALRILMAEGIDASSQVMGFPTEKASVRMLVVGSADVYGPVESTDLPLRETNRPNPVNPYALSKLLQEQSCLQYASLLGVDVS